MKFEQVSPDPARSDRIAHQLGVNSLSFACRVCTEPRCPLTIAGSAEATVPPRDRLDQPTSSSERGNCCISYNLAILVTRECRCGNNLDVDQTNTRQFIRRRRNLLHMRAREPSPTRPRTTLLVAQKLSHLVECQLSEDV